MSPAEGGAVKPSDCSCYYQSIASLPWNSEFEEQIKELTSHAFVTKCEMLVCHMCQEQIARGDIHCYCKEFVDETHFKALPNHPLGKLEC
jgi:hypothetical protein